MAAGAGAEAEAGTNNAGLGFPGYFLLSSSLTAAVVGYAFQTRAQFYPAVIYLVTSKPAMLVLGNMGTCCRVIVEFVGMLWSRLSLVFEGGLSRFPSTTHMAALAATLLWGRVFKAVFLGPLRDVEVEILYDNARYAITETCLALTIFREELTTRCVLAARLSLNAHNRVLTPRFSFL
jgi:E3 ubiquitin-protein ligase synoviolin